MGQNRHYLYRNKKTGQTHTFATHPDEMGERTLAHYVFLHEIRAGFQGGVTKDEGVDISSDLLDGK